LTILLIGSIISISLIIIEEEMSIRLKNFEDSEITRLYDELHSDPEIAAQDKELAEEMLNMNANPDNSYSIWILGEEGSSAAVGFRI